MNMMVSAAALTATPAAAISLARDDAELLALEGEIFEAYDAAEAYNPEIWKCIEIWRAEFDRLRLESRLGRAHSTEAERWEAVKLHPASIEQSRLQALQLPHFERMDELIKKMWSIPAFTSEGRRAKVVVLLTCTMRDDWRENEDDVDWDIQQARSLLIEFVGGEPAKQLRDQFAA